MINTAFQAFLHYELQLAQPSVCGHRDSTSMQRVVLHQPGSALRYTAFVEIMAPMFSAQVMDEVIMPNLNDSYTGYGAWGGVGAGHGCGVTWLERGELGGRDWHEKVGTRAGGA